MADSTSPDAPRAARRRHDFVRGLRDIAPIVAATVPFGMVFGALAVKEGLSFGESVLFSAATFAGASQFVALELWVHPLPFWSIFFSVLAVNLRHVLYSAAIGRRIRHWSPATRYAAFAFLTDPTFALAETRGGAKLSPAYYFGIALPLYLNWIVTTALGAIFGALIENYEAFGIDFVVTAYFIFLIVGFRKRPNAIPVIIASAAGSLVGHLTAGPPWHFAGGAAAGMATAAALAGRRKAQA
jgi:4-azaleucine resistance transporter AzlC